MKYADRPACTSRGRIINLVSGSRDERGKRRLCCEHNENRGSVNVEVDIVNVASCVPPFTWGPCCRNQTWTWDS